ncbi:ArdC-like ssDNA-binding domain-containing protein [Mesorhizobium sp. M0435]|uniref:ArdC-like ssDNA-binding domain-containing protein n=1 Tax=Mesorhizobium sp. M0435 TaxID=2956944 RepID=UPI0033397E30
MPQCSLRSHPPLRSGPSGAACLVQRAWPVAFCRPPHSPGRHARLGSSAASSPHGIFRGRAREASLYQEVTDRIIAELERGTVPWVKPRAGQRPALGCRGMLPGRQPPALQ